MGDAGQRLSRRGQALIYAIEAPNVPCHHPASARLPLGNGGRWSDWRREEDTQELKTCVGAKYAVHEMFHTTPVLDRHLQLTSLAQPSVGEPFAPSRGLGCRQKKPFRGKERT